MTSQQKEIRNMNNEELLKTLLMAVELNAIAATQRGRNTKNEIKYEQALKAEAYERFCK